MRRQLVNHPIRTLVLLLVLAFGFFQLSASGQPGTYWQDGPSWLGGTGWILFLVSALTFLASVGYLLVRRVRTRRTA